MKCLCGNPSCRQGDAREGFVFAIGGRQGSDCTACSGTGEIIEFPAEDDERMVCCPVCGGTGEALT